MSHGNTQVSGIEFKLDLSRNSKRSLTPQTGGRPRNTKNYADMRRPFDQENYAIISG